MQKITLNESRYTASRGKKSFVLRNTEWRILTHLISRRGAVCTRAEILQAIGNEVVETRTIDQHISRLRKKFGRDIIGTWNHRGYAYEA